MRSLAIYLKNVHGIFEHARRDAREIVEAHPAMLDPRNPCPPCPTRSTYATLSNIENVRASVSNFSGYSLFRFLGTLCTLSGEPPPSAGRPIFYPSVSHRLALCR